MTFYWWDDAIATARELASATKIRHRVYRTAGGWTVDLALTAVIVPVHV